MQENRLTYQEVDEAVYKAVSDVSDEYELHKDTLLVDDLGMDSLEITETVMEIEKLLNIEVTSHDVMGLRTYGDAISMAHKYYFGEN